MEQAEREYYQELIRERRRQEREQIQKRQQEKKQTEEKTTEVSLVKKLARLITIFSRIDLAKDSIQMAIITVSLIADIISLLPLSTPIDFTFSVVIWCLYGFSGGLKEARVAKASIVAVCQVLEIFSPLDFLPFFLTSALVTYFIILYQRKDEKKIGLC